MGVRTTKQLKRVGCSTLKTIIENDKLVINDFDILQELTAFSVKGNSFEAEEGYNDDLVMCLVLFAWLSNQEYFKDNQTYFSKQFKAQNYSYSFLKNL